MTASPSGSESDSPQFAIANTTSNSPYPSQVAANTHTELHSHRK